MCSFARNLKFINKMANVKNLKKDINFVLGDIIEAVYLFEMSTTGKPTPETNALIDESIAAFDALITKVNAKKVENKNRISNKSTSNWNKLLISLLVRSTNCKKKKQ